LFTALNLRGIETSARINAAVAAGLGIVIALFFIAALRYIFHLHGGSSAFYLDPVYNRSTFSPPAVFRGTSIAVFTYIGFDGISTLRDEAHDPARTIPRAIVLTCLITGLLASVEVYRRSLCGGVGQRPDQHNAPISRDSNPWLPILLSGYGFVVCFFLWLNPAEPHDGQGLRGRCRG
jgi:putrescine importer